MHKVGGMDASARSCRHCDSALPITWKWSVSIKRSCFPALTQHHLEDRSVRCCSTGYMSTVRCLTLGGRSTPSMASTIEGRRHLGDALHNQR